jgi:glucosamine--fructose-6-phosphate aminotransferase (isomerizing)
MLREVYEQPETLTASVARYVDGDGFRDSACSAARRWLREAGGEIVIAASGSSRHAGLVGELLLEDLSGIAVDVEYASEFCCRTERARRSSGVLVVSQSGETADTLAALRKANAAGRPTLAVTNVAGSSMAREASVSLPTEAGLERAVPATKSFTAQLMVLYLLALMAAEVKDALAPEEIRARLAEVRALPGRVAAQLAQWDAEARTAAQRYPSARSFLYLGRGVHYAAAREGALKLKESAYVHAEGYPGGELKHGPNALVSDGTPLLMIATVDHDDAGSQERYEKMLQLMRDMRQQGAEIVAVANRGDEAVRALAAVTVCVDAQREALLPLVEVIPLQLFAYWMAVNAGVDVDNPRNLTKAVLAE